MGPVNISDQKPSFPLIFLYSITIEICIKLILVRSLKEVKSILWFQKCFMVRCNGYAVYQSHYFSGLFNNSEIRLLIWLTNTESDWRSLKSLDLGEGSSTFSTLPASWPDEVLRRAPLYFTNIPSSSVDLKNHLPSPGSSNWEGKDCGCT